eukprot:TRINITY_DN6082_c0_g1_i1.p1 TRINITY_DN6082_c0_g1~~TRINITY_DN6082_c0_g1_i1.p1  ORF type:complete len:616 (+),score=98.22 TRINITY_DN6082_c0_g1_i1:78-1925(+)
MKFSSERSNARRVKKHRLCLCLGLTLVLVFFFFFALRQSPVRVSGPPARVLVGTCNITLSPPLTPVLPATKLPVRKELVRVEDGKLWFDCPASQAMVVLDGKLLSRFKSGTPIPENAYYGVFKCAGQGQVFVNRPYRPPTSAVEIEDKLNVMIVLLDNVGRYQYQRMYKKTQEFLASLEYSTVFDFEAFHASGTNSLPNKLILWAGTCWERSCKSSVLQESMNSKFYNGEKHDITEAMKLPWLFKLFSEKGYVNYHAEEAAGIKRKGDTYGNSSILNFFADIPREDFIHEIFPGHAFNFGSSSCTRHTCPGTVFSSTEPFAACNVDRLTFQTIFDDMTNFWNTYEEYPKFAGVSLTFDHQAQPQGSACLDYGVVEFLEGLKNQDMFENTVVVLVSDHGSKVGQYFTTPSGIKENMLPLLNIIAPNWLVDDHPDLFELLAENQKKLITHFDLYYTLRQLADFPNLSRPKELSEINYAYSLFDSIPDTRDCDEAGIPRIYCICGSWQSVQEEEEEVQLALALVIEKLNEEIKPDSAYCKPVEGKVLSAEKSFFDEETVYSLLFQVDASYDMIFRSVVIFTGQVGRVEHLEQHTQYWTNVAKYCPENAKIAKPEFCSC